MKFSALQVRQPIGDFYLTAIPASTLLKVCFPVPHTRHSSDEEGNVKDVGNQRKMIKQRLTSIAQYLQTREATLPGTIIIAANCERDGSIVDPMDERSGLRWSISADGNLGDVYELDIPSDQPLAAVVDGQHRLWGFKNLDKISEDFVIPCAVFIDLPSPQQASIFATINFNQRPVNKSQTYELFGYNLDEEPESSWSPEKLAVFFARKLNADPESPFLNHIKVAAIDDRILSELARRSQKDWAVSTATIVECVLKLITRRPQVERDELHKYPLEKRSRELLRALDESLSCRTSSVPVFRDYYLSGDKDIVIYKTIINFFTVVRDLFWKPDLSSPLKKTAGVQALFLVLSEILSKELYEKRDFRKEAFATILERARDFDFTQQIFHESSAKGRSKIFEAFLFALKFRSLDEVRDTSLQNYLKSMYE